MIKFHPTAFIRQKLFWAVALTPQGLTYDDLHDICYGHLASGGPLHNSLSVNIVVLNKQLAPHGLIIRRDPPGSHKTRYNLRRLDTDNIFLPYCKENPNG